MTAREVDPAWTTDVEAAWRTILDLVIQHMTRRYEA